jgi:hypothetical protein
MTDSAQIFRAWPTTVWARKFHRPDLNRALAPLAQRIVAETRMDGGYFFSRRKMNCFRDYADAALLELGRLAFAGIGEYLAEVYDEPSRPRLEISGWPMVQPYGHGIPAHHHIGSHLTAIYYCDVPPLPARAPIRNSGCLILHDPRAANRDWEPVGRASREFKYFEIAVETGLLLIFPGYVTHSVQPWFGEAPRICFAMNVMVHRAHVEEPCISQDDFEARYA